MKLIIDTEARTIEIGEQELYRTYNLYSKEGFEALSRQWVRVGWAMRQYFTFTWLGRPILQLPEDLVRLQEVVYQLKPDVILETGIYNGGSLLYHATLCKTIGRGRVIGVDKHIPPDDRAYLEAHDLAPYITLIEGDSASDQVREQVAGLLGAHETVLVLLDSHHSKAHVLAELNQYARFVTPGSYIVATDGIMRDLHDVPGGEPNWAHNNPAAAAAEFARAHPEFEPGPPAWAYHNSELTENVTYWPGGWMRRRA